MRLEYFHLVDRIAEIDIGARTLRAEALVPETSTIFEGHFPGHPLMPGVLLIETMAQTSGWLILGLNRFKRMPFLVAVKDAKLRSFVGPGTRLVVTAELAHDGSGFAVTRASIKTGAKAVSDAEITFRLMPFPDEKLRAEMEATGIRIGFPMEALADG